MTSQPHPDQPGDASFRAAAILAAGDGPRQMAATPLPDQPATPPFLVYRWYFSHEGPRPRARRRTTEASLPPRKEARSREIPARNAIAPYWRLFCPFALDASLPGAEELILMPEGSLHGTAGHTAGEGFTIQFGLADRINLQSTKPITKPLNDPMRSIVLRAAQVSSAPELEDKERERRLRHLANALLHVVFSELRPAAEGGRIFPLVLSKLLEYIDTHLGEPLTNPILAERSKRGVDSFVIWFREHMHQTPARYVAARRVSRACELLANTRLPLDAIAARLGYPDRFYFSRAFKNHTGTAPATFRRRARDTGRS